MLKVNAIGASIREWSINLLLGITHAPIEPLLYALNVGIAKSFKGDTNMRRCPKCGGQALKLIISEYKFITFANCLKCGYYWKTKDKKLLKGDKNNEL